MMWCSGVNVVLFLYSFSFVIFLSDTPCYAQPGFISLDCGGKENHTDSRGIKWVPDSLYMKQGQSIKLSNTSNPKELQTLRIFPQRSKNCYEFSSLRKGNKYLLRATFLYANYDNGFTPPSFNLVLDFDIYFQMDFSIAQSFSDIIAKEIIFTAKSTTTSFCLAQGNGTPFISTLEIRELEKTMYWPVNETRALNRLDNTNYGAGFDIRYPDDPFDRSWSASLVDYPNVTTHLNVSVPKPDLPPSSVMKTAETSGPDNISRYRFDRDIRKTGFHYLCLYFAELVKLNSSTSLREFDLYIDDEKFSKAPIHPTYLVASNFSALFPYPRRTVKLELRATSKSTESPTMNAIELLRLETLSLQGTNPLDVDALKKIQEGLNYEYENGGDPCLPAGFSWDWIGCSNDQQPRIINLTLAGKGLNGTIPESIASLSALVTVDLSDNNLRGEIPTSLAKLTNLTYLNLRNNNLSGGVPSSLRKDPNIYSGNALLCDSNNESACKPASKTNKTGLIIGGAIGGGVIILLILSITFCLRRRKLSKGAPQFDTEFDRQQMGNARSKRYKYKEVEKITSNFQIQIGKGGFGPVFLGQLIDGQQVAVKVLSDASHQGSNEFVTEVSMLSTVHHKNLVSLVGYCCERNHKMLIYEHMSKGDLKEHLLDKRKPSLPWDTRLRIAVDASKGLEYLHNGCKPQIIHRDIKTSNILLNENMEAKVSDFGLSRLGPSTEESHVTTNVKGTYGYLDPDYASLQSLTEKSDVYSFGVVLFELLTGRAALDPDVSVEDTHLVTWARSRIGEEKLEEVIDKKGGAVANINALWKLAEVGMLCTETQRKFRPNMTQVVIELSEALAMLMTTYSGVDTSSSFNSDPSFQAVTLVEAHNLAPQAAL